MARKLEVIYERAAGGPRAQAPIRDASLGGVFIETAAPFDPGTLVSIEFASGSGFKVQVDGRVISVQKADAGDHKAGMAIRFLDLPDGAASTLGPMFQASRPPARTYLGVGSTEPEIPKAPSVPKQMGAIPAPPPIAAPPPPPEPAPPPPIAPAPVAAPYAAPIPTSQGFPASVPPSSFAPQPAAPGPFVPRAAAIAAINAADPVKRTSPLVWVFVAVAVVFLLLSAAGAVSYLLLFKARPSPPPPPVTAPAQR